MTAAAILNLLPLSTWVTWPICRSDWLQSCKIWLLYVNRRLSYYRLCENPSASDSASFSPTLCTL